MPPPSAAATAASTAASTNAGTNARTNARTNAAAARAAMRARGGPVATQAAAAAPAGAPDGALRQRRLLRALVTVVAAGWLVAAATIAVSQARGDAWKEALRSSSLLQVYRLLVPGLMDSWGPMWSGLTRLREVPAQASPSVGAGTASASVSVSVSVYDLAQRLDRCKFQYPPSSWLLLELLPQPAGLPLACVDGGASGADIQSAAWSAKPWLAAASALACLGLVGISMALLWRTFGSGAPGLQSGSPRTMASLWPAAALAGLGFYPLIKGHTLGQLQVFINLALGAALLLWPRRPRASGLLVGLCCLIKPQYVLLLAWGLLRRRWGFAAALAATAAAGHGLALVLYGLQVHVHYVQLLQGLAQVGEAFWANQSVNGLLNRLLQTGDAAVWAPASFPSYHPLVRWGTFASSAVLLLVALRRSRVPPRVPPSAPSCTPSRVASDGDEAVARLDFATMLAAVTLASPIAWEHHYGSFLPIFALVLGVLATQPDWPVRSLMMLGAAFLAMANAVLRPEWIFTSPLAGLAGSHLWLGAMVLFGLLLVWRARPLASCPSSPSPSSSHAAAAAASR